jgi:hypothetical protein
MVDSLQHESLDRQAGALLAKLRVREGKDAVAGLRALKKSGKGFSEEVCTAALATVIAEKERQGGVDPALVIVREAVRAGLVRDQQAMAGLLRACAAKGGVRVVWTALKESVAGKGRSGVLALQQEEVESVLVELATALEVALQEEGDRKKKLLKGTQKSMSTQGMLLALKGQGCGLSGEGLNALVRVAAATRQWDEALALRGELEATGQGMTDVAALTMLRACQVGKKGACLIVVRGRRGVILLQTVSE